MLTNEQLDELREHLERAQNPLFYYDNDADGLCSFLILRRFLGRGKGVAVRSYPDLNENYVKKAKELKADYVFVLDKPVISRKFVEEFDKVGMPLVWIDHHDVEREDLSSFSNLFFYNPALNKEKSYEPVTYLSYKITERKEDIWLALIGCVADHYMPDFSEEFREMYPDLWAKNVKEPFDVYYKTEIGRIARSFNFGLKDSVTNVVQFQNFLISCRSPRDVFSELSGNQKFRKKYFDIKKKYDSLLGKAKEHVLEKFLFFSYSGELSISSDLSNELSYLFPN